jgi:plastocyanin
MQHVTIDTTDEFRFVPADPTVHAGPVELTLTDSGSYPHNISFGSLHRTSKTVTGSLGQQRTTLTLDLKPGTYDFVCTYHSSAGMKGRLVVK